MQDRRSFVTKSGAVVEVPPADIQWVSKSNGEKPATVTLLVNNQVATRLMEELLGDSQDVSDQ